MRGECIGNRELFFLIIFALLALQMFFGYIQIRHYQKTVKKWLGKGLLGIGHRRGRLGPGEIVVLVYDKAGDRVVSVQSMRGYSVFAHFAEIPTYTGLRLDEIRKIGIEKDALEMKWRRKPYDPAVPSKKKGALIQAVEAIDMRLRREAEDRTS
jgi:glucitol operon activator protein